MSNEFPEAGAVVYTTYKRTDGFEVSFTLRDETGAKVLERLEGAIAKIKEQGGTPIPLRGNGFPKKSKEVEYIEGRVCPKDQAKLIVGQGKVQEKCENNIYDFTLKKNVGSCDYVVWKQMTQADL